MTHSKLYCALGATGIILGFIAIGFFIPDHWIPNPFEYLDQFRFGFALNMVLSVLLLVADVWCWRFLYTHCRKAHEDKQLNTTT